MPDRPPLAGRTALLLRSADRAGPTLAELAARGAATVLCPLIDVELPEDTTQFDDGVRRLLDGGFDWLLLTSRSTVQALCRRAAELRQAPAGAPDALDVPPATRVAVVGEATAAAAADAGLRVDFRPVHDHSARGMLAEWPQQDRPSAGTTVFMPQADLAAPTLADGLRAWGAEARVATAYCTVDAPADPARRLAAPGTGEPQPDLGPAELAAAGGVPDAVQAVLLTSPSIVRRYLALAGDTPAGIDGIAIGDSTAAEMRRHGWEPAAVAVLPTPAGLADAWEHAVRHASPPGS
ncbi:uroporphyrinogen-III synthase [Arthrobacter sp. JSM 101049]|uniref:uroporphyrinogen-III synthase n=1 Tax=Arthrobacter sp. JSM 101049 TaxID=929097 RepID=UPI0035645BFD